MHSNDLLRIPLAEEVFNRRLFEGRTDGRGRVRSVCDGLGNSTRDDSASQKGAVSKGHGRPHL